MALGCSVGEVLNNVKKETSKIFSDGIVNSPGSYSFKFGLNEKFKTESEAMNHIRSQQIKLEAFIKTHIPGTTSDGLIQFSTVGNQINLNFQPTQKMIETLNKAFNENYDHTYYSSNEKFLESLNEVTQEEEKLSDRMDSFFSDELDDINVELLDEMFNGTFDKHLKFLENLMIQAKEQLNNIRTRQFEIINDLKKHPSPELEQELDKLRKKEFEIKNLLDGDVVSSNVVGLKDQIKDFKEDPTISKLKFYSDKSFERLEQLLNSDNIADLDEAAKIINYYTDLGTFSFEVSNPLFKTEEMFDKEGNIIVHPNVKEMLEGLKSQAVASDLRLQAKVRTIIEDIVNSQSTVNQFYKGEKKNYEELFKVGIGLKDITELDKFLMDPSNGIWSHNDIIPQVMQSILSNSYDKSLVKAKKISERVDELTPLVDKILKEAGFSYNAFGISGIKYEEVFGARDHKSGALKKGYISRYSTKFTDNLNFQYREFKNKIEIANNLPKDEFKKAARLKQQAYNQHKEWLKNNTEIIDITRLPELVGKFSDIEVTPDEDYKNKLIDLLGNGDKRIGLIAYNEMLEDQIEKLNKFKLDRQQLLSAYFEKEGVSEVSELSAEAIYSYKRWEAKNNPINFANNIHRNITVRLNAGPSGVVNDLESRYTTFVPKRKLSINYDHDINTGNFKTKEVDSEYYEKRFEFIEKEGNEPLKEFYKLLLETSELVFESLDTEGKKHFERDGSFYLDKSIMEILTNEDLPLLERLGTAIKELYDWFRNLIREKINIEYNNERIDVTTGLPTDRVSAQFFKSTKGEVSERFNVLKSIVQKQFNFKDFKLNNFSDKNSLPKEYIEIIDGLVGPEMRNKLFNSYDGDKIPPYQVLQTALEHKVVSNQSFDLPKLMRFYSFSAMEYQARQEAFPILNLLKQHYKNISNQKTTSQGKPIINVMGDGNKDTNRTEGVRTRANAQIDSWFSRAVLGNFNTKNEFGDTSGKFKTIDGTGKLDDIVNKRLRIASGKKIYTQKEKELVSYYETVLQQKESELDQLQKSQNPNPDSIEKLTKEINQLQNQYNNLGGKVTLVSIIDSILDFIRLKGLGWNLSSQTTNFMEGQIANTIIAASGKYFTPENIYRANQIMQGSVLRNLSFGHLGTADAKKARVLMDRYRVLQDTSNELQRASAQSSYTVAGDLIAPYTLMKRVEYLNQTPLMIALMLDIKVKDKDGKNEITLWDALDENGNFIENYDTESNKKNWVDANDQNFFDFSQKLGKTIVDTHGDYHQLRGNMATEYVSGKAILMFKRWFARQVYSRFAIEQIDIETNQINKGRYRSLTLPTAGLTGAAVGFTGLALIGSGPLGLVIGGALGVGYGMFTGTSSGLGLVQESTFVLREAFLNLIRMPINSLTGKQTIKQTDYSQFNKMQELDLKNFKANIMELSLLLALNGLTLFIKGLLWDDDDEDESIRRRAHNLLVNKLMGLSSQATTYLNPMEMKDMFSEITFLKFLDDVRETAVAAQKAIQGEDTLMAGPNAGGSKLYQQVEKTLFPSVIKSGFGFGSQMQRQFEPSTVDSWFHGPEKKAQNEIKRKKAAYKAELGFDDLSEEEQKELNSILNGLFSKESEELYQDRLAEINRYFEENSIDDLINESQ